jgi:hypothetical protein
MGNVPFTITDALGYVAAGLIIMVAATIAVLGELPTEISIVTGIGIGVGAYVGGHCISGVSTWALDRVLCNDRWGLGRPENVLMGARTAGNAPRVWRTLFANYNTCLPAAIEQRVKTKAESQGLDRTDPASLLTHCEAVVQSSQSYGTRVDRYEDAYDLPSQQRHGIHDRGGCAVFCPGRQLHRAPGRPGKFD